MITVYINSVARNEDPDQAEEMWRLIWALTDALFTFGRIVVFFYKGDNFCDFLFAFLQTRPLLKMVNSKNKEFVPKGSKIFPFSVDSISERN